MAAGTNGPPYPDHIDMAHWQSDDSLQGPLPLALQSGSGPLAGMGDTIADSRRV